MDIYGYKFVNIIETKPLCASWSKLAHMLAMVRRWTLLILVVKGQGHNGHIWKYILSINSCNQWLYWYYFSVVIKALSDTWKSCTAQHLPVFLSVSLSCRHTWCDHTKMIIQCHYGSQATHAFLGMLPLYYIFTVVFSVILIRRWQNEHSPAEIILAWPNMRTYQNLCVAHARFVDDVLLDEYY